MSGNAPNTEELYRTIAMLQKKVNKYEGFLHSLQLHAEVCMDHEKTKKLVSNACSWSYAHRRGNGEYSDEEQEAIINAAFHKLTDLGDK